MILNKIQKAIYFKEINIHSLPVYEEIRVINDPALNRNTVIGSLMITKQYTPSKGDKIYFQPGCTVPRFKVKQMCQKYGVAVVKAPTDPKCINIISPETLENLIISIHSRDVYDKDVILPVLKKITDFKDLVQAIYNSEHQYVYLHYKVRQWIENRTTTEMEEVDWDLRPEYRFVNEDAYNKFVTLMTSPNVFDQNEIINKINDGAVMDKTQYESIKRLLESTSQDDHKVAIEIMANCNYEKSCVFLLLLFKNYGHAIFNCPTRRHVNFKTLIKFFEIQNVARVDLNDIIESLIARKLLNKSNLDMLMPIIMEEIKDSAPVEKFNIAKLEYDEEIAKALEENVLDGENDTDIVVDDEEEINPKL